MPHLILSCYLLLLPGEGFNCTVGPLLLDEQLLLYLQIALLHLLLTLRQALQKLLYAAKAWWWICLSSRLHRIWT